MECNTRMGDHHQSSSVSQIYHTKLDLFIFSSVIIKANLMATTGGKAYLMVLSDILQLANSPEYSSHPKQQPEELVGK